MKQRHLGAKYTCTLHPSEGGIAQSVEHVEVASIPKRPYKRMRLVITRHHQRLKTYDQKSADNERSVNAATEV